MVAIELLFKKDKVLQNDFFLLFKGFAIGIFLVETVQKILDHNDKIVANIDPISRNLTIGGNAFDNLYSYIVTYLS